MTYSAVAVLALLVHCIVNYSALTNRHFRRTTPAGSTYRRLMLSMAAFFFFDALWGVLYDAHLIGAVFADTLLYFVAMTATVFLWTRYVIYYIKETNRLIKALYYAGWVFVAFTAAVLALNLFAPVMFSFDKDGVYHAANMRYVLLCMQIVMFLFSSCYVAFTAKGKTENVRRHYSAIGAFGVAMTVMVILQVAFPLLPFYSAGCLLGACILHTFVLEDLKEHRRLELEEMVRKEQELGSVKQLAYTDALTGAQSTHAYVEAVKRIDERIENGSLKEFGLAVFDLNGLKEINDSRGHEAGDQYLRDAFSLICGYFRESPVFRIGGDEFVAMLEGEEYRNRKALQEAFEDAVERNRKSGSVVVVACGFAIFRPGHDNSCRRIFERADRRMYDRKGALKDMDV